MCGIIKSSQNNIAIQSNNVADRGIVTAEERKGSGICSLRKNVANDATVYNSNDQLIRMFSNNSVQCKRDS